MRQQFRVLARVVSVGGFVALTMAIARLDEGGVADDLFLDPETLAELPWYAGVISDFNLVVWAVSAVVACFAGWVAFKTDRPSAGRFLAVGCVVSTWLLFNDRFLIDTDVLPSVFGFPLALSVVMAMVPVVVWMLGFRHEIRRTRWILLACAFLALCVATIAGLQLSVEGGANVVDDSATFLAACAWGLYLVLTTRDIVRSTLRSAMARGSDASEAPFAAEAELASAA
ncbi:MAG: hypothetical protein HKN94_01515 [Acidimicrobiales bacterium]|nr:hypothetical protein [Acidimicrobiales bacterium]RZV44052.1 MAG: hypothetical protein EX269_12290 [Acidimicrobiales bacterium]